MFPGKAKTDFRVQPPSRRWNAVAGLEKPCVAETLEAK
jgi:hypothetical protein